MKNKIEEGKFIFSTINEWIKLADQKMAILATLNFLNITYGLIKIKKVESWYILFLLIIFILLSIFILYFFFDSIKARLENKLKTSNIYFLHINNKYKENKSKTDDFLKNINEEDFEKDLSTQIVINAEIATKKMKGVNLLIFLLFFQILIGLMMQLDKIKFDI